MKALFCIRWLDLNCLALTSSSLGLSKFVVHFKLHLDRLQPRAYHAVLCGGVIQKEAVS